MDQTRKLLLSNEAWVKEKTKNDPHFFSEMAKDQKPEFLWIGCSDSRVPAEQITGAQPGEIFVHRNIANQVVHSDLNAHSVVQYAVTALKVKNIIVCGHYGCGGVKAAMSRVNYGLLNKWLYNLKNTYLHNEKELKALPENKRVDRLVELSVCEQVRILSHMFVIQNAWKEGYGPNIHGWVFGLNDGKIRELITVDAKDPHIDDIFRFPELDK